MKRNYSYPMSVLYQTIRILLMNCRNNIAAFIAFESMYSVTMIDDMEAELLVAKRMKSDQARTLEHENLHMDMLTLSEVCRDKWQELKRYIKKAVGAERDAANWDAAGWEYYEDSYGSWDKLREMCSMASVYMQDNNAALLAAGTPSDFAELFNLDVEKFNIKYDEFLLAQENAMQGTADKIAANNAIFDKLTELCADGQVIFKRNEVKKSLFSMQAVSELVSPVGASGLKGIVTKDGKAQAGLIVELENGNKHVITAVDGDFDFGNQLGSGKNKLIIRNGDEILSEIDIDIPAGVTKRENVELPISVSRE